MKIKLAHSIFVNRIVIFGAIIFIALFFLASSHEAVKFTEKKSKELKEHFDDYSKKLSILQDNVEKIDRINTIIVDYANSTEIPIDDMVNLIKKRAKVFFLEPTFNINYPELDKSINIYNKTFNFMSSKIYVSYSAINDVIAYAFIDDISTRINGGIELDRISVVSQKSENNSDSSVTASFVVSWDLLYLK
ncbi:hypothetical protein [Candidatus Xenohaliotis californiensis]